MAKSGTIIAGVGTNAALKSEVAAGEPRIATLGAVIAAALAASAVKVLAFADTKLRKVTVADPVAPVTTAENNLTVEAGLEMEEFTPDTPSARSSAFTRTAINATPLSAAMNAALAPVKPQFTVQSLVNRIEDAASSLGKDAVVVVDQVNGKVRAYVGTPAEVAAANIALAIPDANTFAEFAQTDIAVNGGPKDPFE
jgi:hypothetical protein